jgi:folate-binding Fe-S cluster repair protein YgfZ
MLCDLHVLESGDMMLLDVPASEVDAIAARLEQFHFTEDVQIAPCHLVAPRFGCMVPQPRES